MHERRSFSLHKVFARVLQFALLHHEMHRTRCCRFPADQATLSVSLPASCNGQMDCLGTAAHKSLFQRDKATRPASLIHYFSIKIYCEQRARPLYYETRWKIE
jgi:hypothetical protein